MRSTFKGITAGLLAIMGCSLLAFHGDPDTASELIRKKLVLQADSFLTMARLLQSTAAGTNNKLILQRRFREARLTYKRMEWATEYFDPLTSRQVNGPPVPETELNGQFTEPEGLQVIEELLFPHLNPSSRKQLIASLKKLAVNAEIYREYFTRTDLQDWQIMDAVKLEVFRIEALGLNDFDDPLARQCFTESAVALNSVREVTMRYARDDKDRLQQLFTQAIRYLSVPVAFDCFDRVAFLTAYANPLTRELTCLHKQLKLPNVRYNRLLNQDAATLFDSSTFNRNAYIDAPEDTANAQKIALGKKLFFDPRLSGTMTRSCASCHQPDKAFTDGLTKNLDITGKKHILRNTPTLVNAALQPAQFYDLRATSLEDQVGDVIGNQDEMHGDMRLSALNFWQDKTYRKLFADAFPVKGRVTIDTTEIKNALASYIRSLTALNSRFDDYMRGDQKILSQREINGFNLFMGKARCSTCHYLPLFNSVLPPRYMQMDAEVIGVPKTKNSKIIDPDPGLYALQPMEFNRYAFKVTTVRNAARSAPYMHNGVYKTLEEVIDFYDQGGGNGLGLNVPNQTLSAGRLLLSAKEKMEVVAFIRALDNR
ncbi:cytochrome-c peroxidase [Mucilaginibacter lappiensis]|uniref:Cytochrome c peroxidase n=1 Tax=Mucilaginibacter lappiensis TaxID=354630 RepID=A0A841J6N2_9SPHI|nr:cytochrome c peroxidase [Mucilaginibacter lappiensis]MBB6126457.1 cytochrome c peroxidase [Mucilaginibacter lappiensis]